jgi:hypothetical protein
VSAAATTEFPVFTRACPRGNERHTLQASGSQPARTNRLSRTAPWPPVPFLLQFAHEFPFQSLPRALRFPVVWRTRTHCTLSEARNATIQSARVYACKAHAREGASSIRGRVLHQIRPPSTNISPIKPNIERACTVMNHLSDALLRDRALDVIQVTVL